MTATISLKNIDGKSLPVTRLWSGRNLNLNRLEETVGMAKNFSQIESELPKLGMAYDIKLHRQTGKRAVFKGIDDWHDIVYLTIEKG